MQHGSSSKINNERLEFLGDSVLSAVVAADLYNRFPKKNEGELTALRSKMVNRELLNKLGKIIDLGQHIKCRPELLEGTSVIGNCLEALIGAIYIDLGYHKAYSFSQKLYQDHINLDELMNQDLNYKSRLLEWGQKEKKSISFVLLNTEVNKGRSSFESQVEINGEPYGRGIGSNKRKAEQAAAERTLKTLKNAKKA